MDAKQSIYIDCLRVVAALMVFLDHSSAFYLPLHAFFSFDDPLGYDPGRDGVVLFFVTSGYIISRRVVEKDHSLKDYAIKRTARIYSVAIPGVILGLIVSLWIFYAADVALPYAVKKYWLYLGVYFSFTGHTWFMNETPAGNVSYWFLDFEVWYYVLFGLFIYLRGYKRFLLPAALFLLVGIQIWLLMPLFLLGVLLYRKRDQLDVGRSVGRVMFWGSIALYGCAKYWGWDTALDHIADTTLRSLFHGFILEDLKQAQYFLSDYLIALLAAAGVIGAKSANFSFQARIFPWMRKMARYSFSVYLYNMPLVYMVRSCGWYDPSSFLIYCLVSALILSAIIGLSLVTEQKKDAARRLVTRLFDFCESILVRLHLLPGTQKG